MFLLKETQNLNLADEFWKQLTTNSCGTPASRGLGWHVLPSFRAVSTNWRLFNLVALKTA
jgi:hypothetical protein